MRSFRSDNNAGLCPEALKVIQDASDGGHHVGYGDDPYTADAVAAFRDLFDPGTHVFFVATGTAANTLAIASLTRPWQAVLCHANSHWQYDESTAPERVTQCRTIQVHAAGTKIRPEDLPKFAISTRGDVHQPQPGVVTISNPTEFGTVYSPEETRTLAEAAHDLGFRFHVDGARFANAVAHLECDPRDLTINAGVDAVSFGGTKNGLAFGEAVLFFRQGDGQLADEAAAAFPFHRKATGHLLSKHRFLTAPFAATLRDGVWLRHAGHANAMARRLADGLARLGMDPIHPVQANSVFVRIPESVDLALRRAGHGYYHFGKPGENVYRLMCSFDTQPEDVNRLIREAAAVTNTADPARAGSGDAQSS